MSVHRQVLYQEGLRHAEQNSGLQGSSGSIDWRTLQGGLADGVETVTLSNESFRVTVCPTRGMGVLSARFEETDIGWASPVAGPVHPKFVNLHSRNKLGWLEGFSELLCRCGLSSNGPPGIDQGARSPIESDLTLHGGIANTPASFVEVTIDDEHERLSIRGECHESTLFGPRLVLQSVVSLSRDGAGFEVVDTVTNHGSTSTELQLLYHINVGPPFLEEGSEFLTAFQQMSPRDARAAEDVNAFATYLGPTPRYAEQVYYFELRPDDTGVVTSLLKNRSGNLGLSISHNVAQLPCLAQWKCTQPESDGYVTGIEPGINFPNFKSFERENGRVVLLLPGASYETALTVMVHPTEESVRRISDSIADRQSGLTPEIHRSPTMPFAPA